MCSSSDAHHWCKLARDSERICMGCKGVVEERIILDLPLEVKSNVLLIIGILAVHSKNSYFLKHFVLENEVVLKKVSLFSVPYTFNVTVFLLASGQILYSLNLGC